MVIRNIGVEGEIQEALAALVYRKKLKGQKTSIKEEAEKAIQKHVRAEEKKLS